MREMHLEERPKTFKQVVGQKEACQQLIGLGKAEGGLPHCLLFTGPSGCGKTTLGRIVRNKLKCGDKDFIEINAAENRGIEMVRGVQARMNLAPLDGEVRVYLVDECQQLTPDAQGALLKMLEEPPGHVYFMLATTDPQKLKRTIRTRCTEIKVRDLTETEIAGLVTDKAGDRDVELDEDVAAKLAEVSEGSARKALVLLQQVMNLPSKEGQLKVLQNADAKAAAFEIARAIMKKASWKTVAAIIKNCDEEPEGIRWMMLSYFSKVALGGNGRAVDVMEEFADNYFDSKKAGLIISCFRACDL